MLYTYCIVYSVYRVFSHTLHLPAYTYNHIHTCVYIGMSRNHTGRLLASYSHDNRVRFWDLSMFVDDVGGEEEGDDEGDGHNSDLKPAAFSTDVGGDGDDEDEKEGEAMVADEEESGGEGEEEGAWEDMDSEFDAGEEEVEEEEEESSSSDSNNDHDDLDVGGGSDEDSDSDNNVSNNVKGKKGNNKSSKYQNATEKFYADL